ncbi:uncharacterized protein LOC121755070 [Salvia splendens]|nr:uncharacterized protein LOC121755070 [Salvia splendens]XP_042006285.1 uncharacterized protein LOC121755070 [Salvia splendens]
MAGENGRRLDNQNEKPTSNSERIGICEGKQQENGRSPAKISDSSSSSLDNSSTTDSPGSFNQRSGVARDPSMLTESPSIQVMERPKTSDPDSPSQWSVESGDSLFSIHMESSLRISGDIGELSLSEAYLPRVSPKSGESVDTSYTSSAAAAAKALGEARRAVKEDTKYASEQRKGYPPEASSSVPTDQNLSGSNTPQSHDDSDNEFSKSTSESRCPMCQCLWCARMCSCCSWPNCSCSSWFRWPSCSNSCISCPSWCSNPCISCPSCCTNLHPWCSTSCCCSGWKSRVCSASPHASTDRNTDSSSKHEV